MAFKPKCLSLSFIGNITTERSSVVNLTSSSPVIFAPGQWSSEETLLLKKYITRVDFFRRLVVLPVYMMNSSNLFFIFRPQNVYSNHRLQSQRFSFLHTTRFLSALFQDLTASRQVLGPKAHFTYSRHAQCIWVTFRALSYNACHTLQKKDDFQHIFKES